MSLAGNNNMLAHYSHVATIKYNLYYPIFMASMGAAVISLTSYSFTVCTLVSFHYKWPGYEGYFALGLPGPKSLQSMNHCS